MTELRRTFGFAILCRVNMAIEHYKFAFINNICFNLQPRRVCSANTFEQPVINNILEHHFLNVRKMFLHIMEIHLFLISENISLFSEFCNNTMCPSIYTSRRRQNNRITVKNTLILYISYSGLPKFATSHK